MLIVWFWIHNLSVWGSYRLIWDTNMCQSAVNWICWFLFHKSQDNLIHNWFITRSQRRWMSFWWSESRVFRFLSNYGFTNVFRNEDEEVSGRLDEDVSIFLIWFSILLQNTFNILNTFRKAFWLLQWFHYYICSNWSYSSHSGVSIWIRWRALMRPSLWSVSDFIAYLKHWMKTLMQNPDDSDHAFLLGNILMMFYYTETHLV